MAEKTAKRQGFFEQAESIHPAAGQEKRKKSSGKGIFPRGNQSEKRMEFETPAEDRTELADGLHQALAAELAQARVIIGLRNLFEPNEKLQIWDDRQLKGETQESPRLSEFGAAGTMMQTEMTNADKASRQDVREETADKLHRRERHSFGFAFIAIVKIFERYLMSLDRENAMIADGNAEDVASEVFDQFLHAIERGLNKYFPILRLRSRYHVSHIQQTLICIE